MKRPPLLPTDPMPWGEFKGTPMGQLPLHYLDFLLRQGWLAEWPRVFAYVKSREAEIVASRPDAAHDQPKILRTFEDYIRWGRR